MWSILPNNLLKANDVEWQLILDFREKDSVPAKANGHDPIVCVLYMEVPL